MSDKDRADFERWADHLESESKGTPWNVTMYALWELRKLTVGLINALAQDKAQGAGKLKELIDKDK